MCAVSEFQVDDAETENTREVKYGNARRSSQEICVGRTSGSRWQVVGD